MNQNSHSRHASLLRNLVLLLFLLVAFREGEPATVYEQKAFLPATWCCGADLSPDESKVYAYALFGSWNEGVKVYDATSYDLISDFPGLRNVPRIPRVSADGSHFYISAYYYGAVDKRDALTGALVKSIPVGPWPVFLLFGSARRYLYAGVNNPGTGTVGWISVIDTLTDTVVGRVDLNAEPDMFSCLALSPDGNFLYAIDRDPSGNKPHTLFKIDTADLSVQGAVPIPGNQQVALSVHPNGEFVYVADEETGVVHVRDSNSLAEAAEPYVIAHVHNFFAAPDGDHGLVVCSPPGSTEVSVCVYDLSTGDLSDPLVREVGTIQPADLRSPILWKRSTGEALIPICAENGGVIVLSPAGEAWQVVYQADFSTDPGWTTNSLEDFYWNETKGDYHFKLANGGEQYSYKSIPFDSGTSYRLEFDVYMTRCDWAADLYLGLGDPDMNITAPTTWYVSYHKVDQGQTGSLIYYDGDGGSYHPGGLQPAPFQLNTWYHNVVVHDAAAGTLSLRVTKVSDGSFVGEVELTGVGSFAGVDRLYMSSVGHHYASGATAEGYIDNVVLTKATGVRGAATYEWYFRPPPFAVV